MREKQGDFGVLCNNIGWEYAQICVECAYTQPDYITGVTGFEPDLTIV